jgi:hypothetical protein
MAVDWDCSYVIVPPHDWPLGAPPGPGFQGQERKKIFDILWKFFITLVPILAQSDFWKPFHEIPAQPGVRQFLRRPGLDWTLSSNEWPVFRRRVDPLRVFPAGRSNTSSTLRTVP